ncbi:MAG TPA: VCBS repeat-containing protein [Terriglobales bacterium]
MFHPSEQPRIALCICLIAIVFSVKPASAQVTFSQTVVNSDDISSSSIVSGDFDNDGFLDLVTVNEASLSFYKGLGGNSYSSPVNQSVTPHLYQMFVADFNRDGNLDIAVSSSPFQQGGVKIFLGKGDGTFIQGKDITVTGSAGFIALADFNGDRQPDIATTVCNGVNTGSCKVQVFIGQGNGTFKLSSTLPSGISRLVAGDFNADGHQDIAVLTETGVALYLGNGNGTFKSPVLATLPNAINLVVGDFYNNRIQSLAVLTSVMVATESFDVSVYSARYVNGRLVVENQHKLEFGVQAPFQDLAAGDLNGDFKDDIYLTGGTIMSGAQSAYLLGNGNGTFGPLNDTLSWGDAHYLSFIRDLNLDSRHDIGVAWTGFFDSDSGAEILSNTSAPHYCNPPIAKGLRVHICSPAPGQTVGQTFTFYAGGNAANGYAKRMELWIDGKKVAQNLEDQLKAKVTLTRGHHTAAFVVVDAFDNYSARSVQFTASY